MTNKERRIIFIHSKLCSIYNDLNHTLGLFDERNKNVNEELNKLEPLVAEAYLAVERAHEEVEKLANKYTIWEDEIIENDTNSTT